MLDNPINEAEFESRYERVREFLDERGLGGLVAYSPPMELKWGQVGHVAYLSGWASHDRIVESVVVVPAAGQPALLFAGMPYMLEQVDEVSPIKDVRLVKPVDPNAIAMHCKVSAGAAGPRDFASEIRSILEQSGAGAKRVGVVGVSTMPAPFYESLRSGLGEQFERIDDIVAQLRANKHPAEVDMMREAARLSDRGFETMLEVSRPGMRGVEIVAEMERTARRAGADHAKYWMASGPPPNWAETRLDVKPHQRVLDKGDLMASCSYIVYKGFWCHGQRTGTLGKPCEQLAEINAVAREAQDAGLARLRPGASIGEVGATIRDVAAKSDFDMPGGRYGHGIGMDYSEQPVPLNDTNDHTFKEGNTVVIHSTFNLPGSAKMYVPLGDVCHVTADGPELLMNFNRDLFVAGE